MMDEQLAALLLGSMAIIMVVVLIWAVLMIVANWRIFTKAGEAGWKTLIPIYNLYIMYKISWKPIMFVVVMLLAIASGFFSNSTDSTYVIINTVISLASFVINGVLLNVKLAKSFGRGVGFMLGLIFLNPIFMLILAFGDSYYQGPDL